MSKKMIVSALAAAVLVSTVGAASAQDRYRNDRDNNWQHSSERSNDRDTRWQDQRRDDRNNYRGDNHRGDNYRGDNHRGDNYRGDNHRGDNYRGNWGRTADFHSGYDGAGPYHDLRRGGRLPSRYRSHQYVVNDWRSHRLSAPPRGYQWVQTGADYVLVAVATGLIADMILNN